MTTKLERLEAEYKAAFQHLHAAQDAHLAGTAYGLEAQRAARALDKVHAKLVREQAMRYNATQPPSAFSALQATGRCGYGERDRGRLYHAVCASGVALCGYAPGRNAGWSRDVHELSAVDCPRCMKLLAKKTEQAEPLAA